MTTVAKRESSPAAMLSSYVNDFATVLPTTGVNAATFVRRAQSLLRSNKQLARVAAQNPGSFFAALLDCASLGHEPGSGAYHFVIFGNAVTGIEDYTGKIDRIGRAGRVDSIIAETVHENDVFTFNPGRDRTPNHEVPSWFEDRGEIVGAYAYAHLKGGAVSRVVIMSKAEIDKHRKESRGSDGSSSPWTKWYRSMALKTVIHELEKWVPSSAEYREEIAQARASADEIAKTEALPGVTPQALAAAADHNDRYDESDAGEPDPPKGIDTTTGEISDEYVDAEIVDGELPPEEPW